MEIDDKPLYRQVYDELQKEIENGTYSENGILPTERALCASFHVSRSTIRRALDDLQQDGYIVKAQGNGNYVKPRVFDQKLTNFHSFAGSLDANHIRMKNQILDCELIESCQSM